MSWYLRAGLSFAESGIYVVLEFFLHVGYILLWLKNAGKYELKNKANYLITSGKNDQ